MGKKRWEKEKPIELKKKKTTLKEIKHLQCILA